MQLVDGFDTIGQRLTARGTTHFVDAVVCPYEIRSGLIDRTRRNRVSPLFQLFLGRGRGRHRPQRTRRCGAFRADQGPSHQAQRGRRSRGRTLSARNGRADRRPGLHRRGRRVAGADAIDGTLQYTWRGDGDELKAGRARDGALLQGVLARYTRVSAVLCFYDLTPGSWGTCESSHY